MRIFLYPRYFQIMSQIIRVDDLSVMYPIMVGRILMRKIEIGHRFFLRSKKKKLFDLDSFLLWLKIKHLTFLNSHLIQPFFRCELWDEYRFFTVSFIVNYIMYFIVPIHASLLLMTYLISLP